jgi:hypothetical protein
VAVQVVARCFRLCVAAAEDVGVLCVVKVGCCTKQAPGRMTVGGFLSRFFAVVSVLEVRRCINADAGFCRCCAVMVVGKIP